MNRPLTNIPARCCGGGDGGCCCCCHYFYDYDYEYYEYYEYYYDNDLGPAGSGCSPSDTSRARWRPSTRRMAASPRQ